MAKYHVRLTLTVEADDHGDAVSEFAMSLAEFGTLNWLFFVENLETGEATYVNRTGEPLDEATLGYMKQTLDAYNTRQETTDEGQNLAEALLDEDANEN